MPELSSRPLKVFISYSHQNTTAKEDIIHFLTSTTHPFEFLSDDLLKPADDWNLVLTRLREEADVFLLLVSPSYLASKKIPGIELPHIIERGNSGKAYVIPVILEDCEWQESPFAKFQALPKFGKPVSQFENTEEAYIALREALEALCYLLLNKKALELIEKCKQERSLVLDLSDCGLHNIPRDLLSMDWLTHLHLQINYIRRIENVENLGKLEHLDLADNQIEEIENLEKLTQLKYLDFEKNRLSQVNNLEHNATLEVLGLAANGLESLAGTQHLLHLQTLLAGRNKLRSVHEITRLTGLKQIVLTDNLITSIHPLLPHIRQGIPVEIKYTSKENRPGIFIKDNPISDPPMEVITMGTDAILDHFSKSKQYGLKKLEILKLILVGNSGVGKTNLSQFLRAEDVNINHLSTDTLEIQTWENPFLTSESGQPMRINIFDFGGQDYYHDLHRLYYSHDTAYVLLWDTATNSYSEREETLDDDTKLIYENFPIEYWLESIRYNLHGKGSPEYDVAAQNKNDTANPSSAQPTTEPAAMPEKAIIKQDLLATAPVLVLQNKIDTGEGLLNQVVLRETYPNISTFFNISITAGSRVSSIHEVLNTCLSKLNLAGRKLISYQHEIIEAYLQSNIRFEVLPLADFKERCERLVPAHKGMLDMADANIIARVLANLGIVFFDMPASGNSSEEGIVFTRIDELNHLIKEVMKVVKSGADRDKGICYRNQIADIKHIEDVLPLLIKNRSLIPLADEAFLVPLFLPVIAEPHVENFIKAFVHCQIRYIYKAYFHKSVLMSLFATFLSKEAMKPESSKPVKSIYYWRNGLILSREDNGRPQMVFIHFIKEPASCRIEIRTLYPFSRTGLEREIEKEMDTLNQGWSFCKEVAVNSTDFFEVNSMIKQAEQNDFIFHGQSQTFTVNDFKDLVTFTNVPKKLFISYSSRNDEFVKRFWTHLDVLKTAGYIEPWFDRKIEPGAKWDDSIQREMLHSDLIIFLLSPDFLATSYIMNVEVRNAMEMEAKKQCELFFIQLLHCSWQETDLKKYQLMLDPDQTGKKEVCINTPGNDEAWRTIIRELKKKVLTEKS